MSRALVIVEGPDDLRALREILHRSFGLRVRKDMEKRFEQCPLVSEDETRFVHLANGKNRRSAGLRAVEAITEYHMADYDRVGLVFDPDHHKDIEWCEWCGNLLRGIEHEVGEPVWTVRHDRAEIPFVPVAWDAGPSFAGLPEKLRNLERVALAIAHNAVPEDTALVQRFLDMLREAGRKVTWKTAFRLLHALRKPDSDAGIVDQVFGQDPKLRGCVDEILQSTRLWTRLSYLAGAPDCTP